MDRIRLGRNREGVSRSTVSGGESPRGASVVASLQCALGNRRLGCLVSSLGSIPRRGWVGSLPIGRVLHVPGVQRVSDREDPDRFATVHQNLFVRSRTGGQRQPWAEPDRAQGRSGTAAQIIAQYKAYLTAYIQANPMSVGGTVTTRTTESAAETDAIAADQSIRTRFPQITTSLGEAQVRGAVGVIKPAQTSSSDVLRQWLANQLSRRTDIDQYDIRESDSRYQQMLTDLLGDSWAGPHIRTLVGRQAAFVETTASGRLVSIHRGASAASRMPILIHEMVHFYAHDGYKRWVAATTAERFYNEGFTEYLARLVMSSQQRSARTSYQDPYNGIASQVAPYVSEDDIARAYFRGEAWRLEGSSAVSASLFESQIGIAAGGTRRQEVGRSRSGPGIVQVVTPGAHYRLMNLGVGRETLKPEHLAALVDINTRHVVGQPAVRLRFVGHASTPGSAAANADLARLRAAAFYATARAVGIPAGQLLDEANPPHSGETSLTASEGGVHARAFNRRVELFITRVPSP